MINLNGKWEMRSEKEAGWLKAAVPGTMYRDLLDNNKMEDPFKGENEFEARELSAMDYYYRRTFEVTEQSLKNDKNVLVCEGIDTLADITVNGVMAGHCENMHRIYRFDVTALLQPGENRIEIHFHGPLTYARRMDAQKPIWGVDTTVAGYQYIRKAHCMFGWDWGPQLPDLGIWRDIYIEEVQGGRIDSVYVRQKNKENVSLLTLQVQNEIVKAQENLALECCLFDPEGELVFSEAQPWEEHNSFQIEIKNPSYWWPNGYGEQPLYRAELRLCTSGQGNPCSDNAFQAAVSQKTLHIGIRDLTVIRRKDRFGEAFTFSINGKEIFARGANYIPEDSIFGRRSKERTEQLLEDCVRSGFNCIRVWGGGCYPDDWFFDACDRLGLIVWEDFMFACAVYDLTDDFAENLRGEFVDNIRRLRNHPSLGLWCGNNEMESAWVGWGLPENEKLRQDYLILYERMIPSVLAKEDPDRFYWPSSPSSGGGFEDPSGEDRGDAHYWDVWHGKKPFEDVEKKYFRFFSEYGFVSLPSRQTLEAVIDKDQLNIVSPQMEMHQKCALGNLTLMHYLLRYYRNPADFDTLIYATQSLQGDYLEMAVRHLRSNRERCAGSTYWQVNDTYPTMSWATIDYYGRWKGAQYIVKRSYGPLIAYGEIDDQTRRASIYVSGEFLQEKEVTVSAELVDQKRGTLIKESKTVLLTPLSSIKVMEIPLPEQDMFADRECYLHYSVAEEGRVADEGNRLLTAPKQFAFRDPELKAVFGEEQGRGCIDIQAGAFARRIALVFEADVILSDNYFDLHPEQKKRVWIEEIRSEREVSLEELEKGLRIFSNYDIR